MSEFQWTIVLPLPPILLVMQTNVFICPYLLTGCVVWETFGAHTDKALQRLVACQRNICEVRCLFGLRVRRGYIPEPSNYKLYSSLMRLIAGDICGIWPLFIMLLGPFSALVFPPICSNNYFACKGTLETGAAIFRIPFMITGIHQQSDRNPRLA